MVGDDGHLHLGGIFMNYYIPQINQSDCGFACLKMLVAHLYGDQKALYIPQDETKGPYSIKNVIELAANYGITLNGVDVEEKEKIKEAKFPFIALLQRGDELFHYVLVTKVKLGTVYYLDPDEGECTLSKKNFIKEWTGAALMVSYFEKKDINFNVNLPVNKDKGILTALFQLFTAIFLVLGIYFIDQTTKVYIPVIFLSAAFLSEILLRVFLIKRMEKLDDVYLNHVNVERKFFYSFYERYEDYKKQTITSKMNFIFSLVIILFVTVVVLLNNIYNAFIVLVPLFIAILDVKYTQPSLEEIKKSIGRAEKELTISKNVDMSRTTLGEIHSLTYQYARKVLLKKYVQLFLSLIISLLTTVFNETFSLPYVIFYFAITYMLLEQYINFLNYPNARKEELKAKVRLNNVIDNR